MHSMSGDIIMSVATDEEVEAEFKRIKAFNKLYETEWKRRMERGMRRLERLKSSKPAIKVKKLEENE